MQCKQPYRRVISHRAGWLPGVSFRLRITSISVPTHRTVSDSSYRGGHIEYQIVCTAVDASGCRDCTAWRRYSEWRQLHAALSKLPFPEPRRLTHSASLINHRREALEAYLQAAVATAEAVSPELGAFLCVADGAMRRSERPEATEEEDIAAPPAAQPLSAPAAAPAPASPAAESRLAAAGDAARAWLRFVLRAEFFGATAPLVLWLAFGTLWLFTHVDFLAALWLLWAVAARELDPAAMPIAAVAVATYLLDAARAAWGEPHGASAEARAPRSVGAVDGSMCARLWWGVAIEAARHGEPLLAPVAAVAAAHAAEAAVEMAVARARRHAPNRHLRWVAAARLAQGAPDAAAALLLPVHLWRESGPGPLVAPLLPRALSAFVGAAILKEAVRRPPRAPPTLLAPSLRLSLACVRAPPPLTTGGTPPPPLTMGGTPNAAGVVDGARAVGAARRADALRRKRPPDGRRAAAGGSAARR